MTSAWSRWKCNYIVIHRQRRSSRSALLRMIDAAMRFRSAGSSRICDRRYCRNGGARLAPWPPAVNSAAAPVDLRTPISKSVPTARHRPKETRTQQLRTRQLVRARAPESLVTKRVLYGERLNWRKSSRPTASAPGWATASESPRNTITKLRLHTVERATQNPTHVAPKAKQNPTQRAAAPDRNESQKPLIASRKQGGSQAVATGCDLLPNHKADGEGFEPPAKSSDELQFSPEGDAESDARDTSDHRSLRQSDRSRELCEITATWPRLPQNVRDKILAIVRSARASQPVP